MTVGKIACGSRESHAVPGAAEPERLRVLAEKLPRPLRFLAVGGCGLVTDISLFTLVLTHWPYPLFVRLLSLGAATLVTWRLNRALTFDRSGRRPRKEAMRYAAVTVAAQSTSYAVFAILTFTVLAWLPQAALLIGAAAGTLISYNGHRLYAFAPATRSAAVGVSDRQVISS
jgi:putative flippase GtrA